MTSLVGVPLRFRKDATALAADIEEMFMQMRVTTWLNIKRNHVHFAQHHLHSVQNLIHVEPQVVEDTGMKNVPDNIYKDFCLVFLITQRYLQFKSVPCWQMKFSGCVIGYALRRKHLKFPQNLN